MRDDSGCAPCSKPAQLNLEKVKEVDVADAIAVLGDL